MTTISVATIMAQHINLGKIANSKATEIIVITNLSLLILPDQSDQGNIHKPQSLY